MSYILTPGFLIALLMIAPGLGLTAKTTSAHREHSKIAKATSSRHRLPATRSLFRLP